MQLKFGDKFTQPISQTTYDLNNELLVRYSGHGLNNEPFEERTVLDHSNTELVRYSDPHCIEQICVLNYGVNFVDALWSA